MFRKIVMLMLLAIMLTPVAVRAELSPFAPIFAFEMSAAHRIQINGESESVSILTFYESSQNWVLFLRHNNVDDLPYDNLSVTVECNGEDPVTFDTTDYSQWVDEGILSVEFPYQQSDYGVVYNSINLAGKYSMCVVNVEDYGGSSYANNSYNYTEFNVETIPFLATLEFIDCNQSGSSEINLLNQMSSTTNMMTNFWDILWLVFSIASVVLGVFMIPVIVFILIRWFLFRVAGIKIVERSVG